MIINEDEKRRILNLHETRKSKEWNSINEQVVSSNTVTTPTTAATTASTATTATSTAATQNSETKVLNDRDYAYKKEGDKYFFKLQTNPGSDEAKKFKAAKKYLDWTEATGEGLKAIKNLKWGQSEKMAINMPTKVDLPQTTLTAGTQTQLAGTQPQQPVASGAGGTSLPGLNNIKDQGIKDSILAWSKTPAGQYVIKTAPEQREAALDNLDRVRGDKETRRLKKDIRTALGMMADTGLGRFGQRVQGAVQGAAQGFQNPTQPVK